MLQAYLHVEGGPSGHVVREGITHGQHQPQHDQHQGVDATQQVGDGRPETVGYRDEIWKRLS